MCCWPQSQNSLLALLFCVRCSYFFIVCWFLDCFYFIMFVKHGSSNGWIKFEVFIIFSCSTPPWSSYKRLSSHAIMEQYKKCSYFFFSFLSTLGKWADDGLLDYRVFREDNLTFSWNSLERFRSSSKFFRSHEIQKSPQNNKLTEI